MKLKRVLAMVFALCLVAGLLSGCGTDAKETDKSGTDSSSASSGSSSGSSSSSSGSASKTTLNVVADMFSEPNILDLNGSWGVMRLGVSECLVKFGNDSSYQPWLAESWELADDGLTWTFHIRSGVKFSNGVEMTPTKVKESIEYTYAAQDPENGGKGDIQGFMKYTSIEADDAAGTVTIVTAAAQADMPGVMAYPLTAIMDVEATSQRDLLLEGPICTGPYVIASYTDGHDYQLTKNTYYWDGEVPFENVSYVKVAEAGSRLNALLDGSADVATHIQASDLPTLQSGGYTISNVSGARDGYYHINFEGPLGNNTLRKAVLMAIDDETVCNITTGGSYTAGYTPLAPTYPQWGGSSISDPAAYNPDGAKKLLDDAGIVDTDGDGWRELDGKNIELTYVTVTSRQMGEIAQAHAVLIQAIGINCNVQIVDSQGDYMANGTFDLVNSNEMIIPTGDPTNFLSHWYGKTGTGYNYSRYSNAEYDKLYEELKSEMSVDKRNDLIKQLQTILTEDCALLLAGYYNFNICSSPAVKGAYNPPCDFYWITKDIRPAS